MYMLDVWNECDPVELTGGAAVWAERSLMRVVLFSDTEITAGQIRQQSKVLQRMQTPEKRCVLYDARCSNASAWGQGRRLSALGMRGGIKRVALVVRSSWWAKLENLRIRFHRRQDSIRVFRTGEAAETWLARRPLHS
jgi:hypothetical protein